MKIGIMVYSLGGGGAEKMAVTLSKQFTDFGNTVTIYAFCTDFFAYELDSKIKLRRCDIKEQKNKILKGFKRVKLIRNYLKQDQNDILLAVTISMVPYALAASKGLKCKVIGSERANPFIHNNAYQFIIKYISPLCQGFVFQTKGAQAYYPLKTQGHSTIISNIASQNISPCQWHDITKICSVGRLHPDKDFPTLLRAFAIVNRKIPQTILTIFGDGPQREQLVLQTRKLGIENKVIFRGFVKNINEELKEYSIFAFSSRAEGMPNALLDAMSAGMGCISTDCPFGPSDLIQNGINGFLVPVQDEEAMADRILWMLQHPIEAKIMGEKARTIQKTNSEDIIADKYLSYFKNIL